MKVTHLMMTGVMGLGLALSTGVWAQDNCENTADGLRCCRSQSTGGTISLTIDCKSGGSTSSSTSSSTQTTSVNGTTVTEVVACVPQAGDCKVTQSQLLTIPVPNLDNLPTIPGIHWGR